MNLRIHSTPLAAALPEPALRTGGVDPSLMPAFHAHGAARDQLARLRDPDTLVVSTGQQPGLFTGPLYTIHKALSAAALARRLEAAWGHPVVPVFWTAGDDHDFAEVNHAAWLDPGGALRTVTLRERAPDAPLTPMYREPLGPEVEAALDVLAGDLPPSEYRDDTLRWLGDSYRRDATVAGAYRDALAELLGPAGVVVFESTHRSAKVAAAPLLLQALAEAAALNRELSARATGLREAGADAGVAVGDGATLVMLEARLGRDRLIAADGGFTTRRSGERFTPAELERIAGAEPERLSPNVLLRPVVESTLLPTVAYVAGPGELRYLALTPPVYDRLDVVRQVPVPRWSGVLVEPRVDRVLDKFRIELDDLLDPESGVERRVILDQLPRQATEALASLRSQLEAEYARVAEAAGEVDPTLVKSIEGTRNQALAGTHEIEKKLIQHLKRRQETELGQLTRAKTAVAPDGKPQERVLTVAPFLARHGPSLTVSLLAAAEEWYAGALEGAAARK